MEEAARAERVIVINDGAIALDGTPRDVFAKVDKLRRMGLEAPQGNELVLELQNAGLNIKGESLTESECVETLYKFLS
jgi:energy-coupling factor transport system ATP-binding protein